MADNDFAPLPMKPIDEVEMKEEKGMKSKMRRGLTNPKNQCYFNVIRQCLSSCDSFVCELEKNYKVTVAHNEQSVAASMRGLISELRGR